MTYFAKKLIGKLFVFVSIMLPVAMPVQAEIITIEGLPAQTALSQVATGKSRYQGDIYLLRGFGDVFSRGLDEIGTRLNARGIGAKVIRHADWRFAARAIFANQKKYGPAPVVLIGHSLGANAIIRIAEKLKRQNIAVQYLATLEPTQTLEIPSNVKIAVNYYLSNSSMGLPLKKQRDSSGSFKNVNLAFVPGIGHFNIDEQPGLQQIIISRVLQQVSGIW